MDRGGAALRRTGWSLPLLLGRWLAPVIATAVLSGCGSISEKMADTMAEAPGIGLPAGAPTRPTEALAYPAVHDVPPPRPTPMLTGIEQKQIEDDLLAARDGQKKLVAEPAPAPKKDSKVAKKEIKLKPRTPPPAAASAAPINPVSSARTIY
jgi:hypothetical protein